MGIPTQVAQLAEETAVQEGRNILASKKMKEQEELGKVNVAKAEAELQVARLQAQAKDVLSQPKMLELYRAETERIKWEGYSKTGKSPFGEGNIFGDSPSVLLQR